MLFSESLHALSPLLSRSQASHRALFTATPVPRRSQRGSSAPRPAGGRGRAAVGPGLPAGSPLPRAGKCRNSPPSAPAPRSGLDRSRRGPATGCKNRSRIGDGITTIETRRERNHHSNKNIKAKGNGNHAEKAPGGGCGAASRGGKERQRRGGGGRERKRGEREIKMRRIKI